MREPGRPRRRGGRTAMMPWRTRPSRLRLLVMAVADRCDQRCVHCQIWQGERVAVAHAGGAARAWWRKRSPRASRRRCSPAASRSCRRTSGRSRERLRDGGARLMLATNGMLLGAVRARGRAACSTRCTSAWTVRTRRCTTRSAAWRRSRASRRASPCPARGRTVAAARRALRPARGQHRLVPGDDRRRARPRLRPRVVPAASTRSRTRSAARRANASDTLPSTAQIDAFRGGRRFPGAAWRLR